MKDFEEETREDRIGIPITMISFCVAYALSGFLYIKDQPIKTILVYPIWYWVIKLGIYIKDLIDNRLDRYKNN